MSADIMWIPSPVQLKYSQMTDFLNFVNESNDLNLQSYNDLYQWSVDNIEGFWGLFWKWSGVIASHQWNKVVSYPGRMPGALWFGGSKLNFAENLLKYRDERTAIIFRGEEKVSRELSYRTLYEEVSRVARALKKNGVNKGDRVAGFIPNLPEAIIAMLAAASIGAVWSSSSPDFGIKGVLDRFSQIEPKILFAANGYYYNGKEFNSLEKLQGILGELPSVEKVVVIPYTDEEPDFSVIQKAMTWQDFIKDCDATEMEFEQLPFDHPLYIMYSSGTTGLPKSIVHGAGGTLLQHLKELRLHTNLTRVDRIFYFTTCGWMMWNWLVSSLAVGASVVLYDGNPFYPSPDHLWRIADEVGITVFGTSAKFIAASEAAGVIPADTFELKKLRTILSTGSPLVEENYDYVYSRIKKDVQLSSISGGTDIISCFALGNPILPVYRGELQCRGLGMDVHAYDQDGNPVLDTKGELVCTKPFPSMPVFFWNDEDGSKYFYAYFSEYKNTWYHGDYISINDHGGIKIFGRSDATLNPGGVRIGTAEIYRVIDTIPGIVDSLVVGQRQGDDERVILFLKMNEGQALTEDLIKDVGTQIRKYCSPRHVPALVLPVRDIPYTINGKKVEIAVKKIIHNQDVTNKDALANPESLEFYRDLPELK